MNEIRTVDLEMVRSGPPQNQLLSPLTRYLALCGNFRTTTVHVPWEHRQFMRRLTTLRYQEAQGDETGRHAVLDETAREMADILGSVPGLAAAMSSDMDGPGLLTHLNLVMSPAELALMPFELSKVPPNCPGDASSWLSLQTVAPVVITRQVRNVSGDRVSWPLKPKILFIASSPVGTIPFRQHLHALLAAIQPWIEPRDGRDGKEDGAAFRTRISDVLTILPDADIHQIEEACSKERFTHVHILAHGMEDPDREGSPFGLALRARTGRRVDVVSGSRMATVLRTLGPRDAGPAHPSVVTVASCDSGNVGDVTYTGASFAHELHQEGIPFVVASQFPLSKAGSVHVVEVLYDRLLWGEDPRTVLHALRRKLFALHAAATHDWASLVVYCALPANLADQLVDTTYAQAKAAIDVALKGCDTVIGSMKAGESSREGNAIEGRVEALLAKADRAASRMPTGGKYETEGLGLRASTEKRKAEIWFHLSVALKKHETSRDGASDVLVKSLESLRRAQSYYESATNQRMTESSVAVQKGSLHWVLTQYLSASAVLGEPFLPDHWTAAKFSAERELQAEATRVWAHGSLAELHAILPAYPEAGGVMAPADAWEAAREHCLALLRYAGPGSFAVQSTRRQLQRYVDWWGDPQFSEVLKIQGVERPLDWSDKGGFHEGMRQLAKIFPPEAPPRRPG